MCRSPRSRRSSRSRSRRRPASPNTINNTHFDGLADVDDDDPPSRWVATWPSITRAPLPTYSAPSPRYSAPSPRYSAPTDDRISVILPFKRAEVLGPRSITVRRDALREYLPRAPDPVRGTLDLTSYFSPGLTTRIAEDLLYHASQFIFEHLGNPRGVRDMFQIALGQLATRPSTVEWWASIVHAMCVLLDNDTGLGCSEGLLYLILDFEETLFRHVRYSLGLGATIDLFEQLGRVFRGENPTHLHILRTIWTGFDSNVRGALMEMMEGASTEINMQRIYHALVRMDPSRV